MVTLVNLKHLYGGGYEIATILNQKFAKVDDITYLFWGASVDAREAFGLVGSLRKHVAIPTTTTYS